VVSLITDKKMLGCCILAAPRQIGRRFLADPADMFPGTNGRKLSLVQVTLAQARPLAQVRYNFDSFSAKELIAWRQQKSVTR
jgi:hypothetical protein